jgi:hypothetical protein
VNVQCRDCAVIMQLRNRLRPGGPEPGTLPQAAAGAVHSQPSHVMIFCATTPAGRSLTSTRSPTPTPSPAAIDKAASRRSSRRPLVRTRPVPSRQASGPQLRLTTAAIIVEWHGYRRAYPPGRRQIVGAVLHLADRWPYGQLNDVCVCVGEVRHRWLTRRQAASPCRCRLTGHASSSEDPATRAANAHPAAEEDVSPLLSPEVLDIPE